MILILFTSNKYCAEIVHGLKDHTLRRKIEILHYYCITAKNSKYEFDTDEKSKTRVIRAKQCTGKSNLRQRDGTYKCVICNNISK